MRVEQTCRGYRENGVHDPEATSGGLEDNAIALHCEKTAASEPQRIYPFKDSYVARFMNDLRNAGHILSEMSPQIIPSKDRTDLRESSRILATETIRV
jgi:hypothetical protein